MKRQATDQRKIFAKHISGKGFLSKIYKELNNKKTKIQQKKCVKNLNRYLTKGDMANKHMKTCSTQYVIKELQIKTAMSYHYTPIRMAKLQNTDNTKC